MPRQVGGMPSEGCQQTVWQALLLHVAVQPCHHACCHRKCLPNQNIAKGCCQQVAGNEGGVWCVCGGVRVYVVCGEEGGRGTSCR